MACVIQCTHAGPCRVAGFTCSDEVARVVAAPRTRYHVVQGGEAHAGRPEVPRPCHLAPAPHATEPVARVDAQALGISDPMRSAALVGAHLNNSAKRRALVSRPLSHRGSGSHCRARMRSLRTSSEASTYVHSTRSTYRRTNSSADLLENRSPSKMVTSAWRQSAARQYSKAARAPL